MDLDKDGLARIYDARPDAATYLFLRGDPKLADQERPLSPSVPQVMGGELVFQPVSLPVEGYYPAMREFVAEEMIAAAKGTLKSAEDEASAAKEQWMALKHREKATVGPSLTKAGQEGDGDPQRAHFPKDFLSDDFAKPRPELWNLVRGQWEHIDGQLWQKQIVSEFSPLATLQDHPTDFTATLEFKPTGGNVYRSVGVSFDWVKDRDFHAVYLSANDGQPTVSAFNRREGTDSYPPQAIVPHPIKVGLRVKLEVLVRGDVLNVKVDDQLKLAYRLPVARQSGKFAIWTYDAAAEFYRVRVAELPLDANLTPPGMGAVAGSLSDGLEPNLNTTKEALALAEKKVSTANAKLTSIEVRIAAERAKHNLGDPTSRPDTESLAAAAVQAERQAAFCEADENHLAATHELARANPPPKRVTIPNQNRVWRKPKRNSMRPRNGSIRQSKRSASHRINTRRSAPLIHRQAVAVGWRSRDGLSIPEIP